MITRPTNSVAGSSFTSTASPVVTLPLDTQDGDILLFIFQSNTVHDSSGTPPAGVTKIVEVDENSDSSMSVFWKRASSEGASITFTNIFAASETGIYAVVAYRGVVASGSPLDVAVQSSTNGVQTAKDCPAITPITANAMVVGIVGTDPDTAGQTMTWDVGVTEVADGTGSGSAWIGIGEKLVATPASTSLGGDLSEADGASLVSIALRPATSSPTISPSGIAHTRAQGSLSVEMDASRFGKVTWAQVRTPFSQLAVTPTSQIHTRGLGTHTLRIDIEADPLVHARSLGSPAVNEARYGIVSWAQMQWSPALGASVSPSGLVHARGQGSAFVDRHGNIAAAGLVWLFGDSSGTASGIEGIIHIRGQGSPRVNPSARPASIVHTRAQGSHLVSRVTPRPASLAHSRILGSHHVSTGAATNVIPSLTRRAPLYGSGTYGGSGGTYGNLQPAWITNWLGAPKANSKPRAASQVHNRFLGTHSINPRTRPAALAHTRALGTQSVFHGARPTAMVHTRAQGAPRVTQLLKPLGLAHIRGIGVLRVLLSLKPAGLIRSRALGSPRATQLVKPAAQTHTRALGTIDIDAGIETPSIIHTRGASSGIVLVIGKNARPTGQAHTRAQGAFVLNVKPRPSGLVHARALGAPNLIKLLKPTGLDHSATLGDPRATQILLPDALEQTRALGSPQVNIDIGLGALVHARTLGAPLIVVSLPPESLDHSRALGVTTLGKTPAGLLQTRALGDLQHNIVVYNPGLDHGRTLGNAIVPSLFAATESIEHARILSAISVRNRLNVASIQHNRQLGLPRSSGIKIWDLNPRSFTYGGYLRPED